MSRWLSRICAITLLSSTLYSCSNVATTDLATDQNSKDIPSDPNAPDPLPPNLPDIFNPIAYFTFDNPSAGTYNSSPRPSICPDSSSTSSACLNFQYYGSNYKISNGGQVGPYLDLTTVSAVGFRDTAEQLSGSFTVEFLFKPTQDFQSSNLIATRLSDGFSVSLKYPELTFSTTTKDGSGEIVHDNFTVILSGKSRGNYSHLFDNNWHHLAFTYEQTTGIKRIYIDGYSFPEFKKIISPGPIQIGQNAFTIGDLTHYRHPYSFFDEVAMHKYALPYTMIYQHYMNTIVGGQHYNFTGPGITPSTIDSISVNDYDPKDFAPFTNIPTVLKDGRFVDQPSSVPSVLTQLRTFPTPRYRTGHTLERNFNWMDSTYLAGSNQQGMTVYDAGPILVNIEKELNLNWHYLTSFGTNGNIYTSAPANNSWDYYKLQAVNSPELAGLPIDYVTLRVQLDDVDYFSQSLSSNCYLKNASGQYLNSEAGLSGSTKYIRPTKDATGPCPDSNFADDGVIIRNSILSILNHTSKNVRIITDNAEMLGRPSDQLVGTNTAKADPTVKSELQSSGLPDFFTFFSRWRSRLDSLFRDTILNTTNTKLSNAKYTTYSVDGDINYHFKWSEMRNSQSSIGGRKLPTGYMYMRNPTKWHVYSHGADHGLGWFQSAKYHERLSGDEFISPYISPGWNIREEYNLRPGRWLGMLKIMHGFGTAFSYTGFFNSVDSYQPGQPYVQEPRNWVWQAAIPSYAQAAVSRFDDFFMNSKVMEGDTVVSYDPPSAEPGYRFETGNSAQFVTVRKHNSLNKYLIFGTHQPLTNFKGEPLASDATIQLDGQSVTFEVRRQGSVYVYDKTVSPAIFYQVDDWHESSHPWYWSKNTMIDAAVSDNISPPIKTEVPSGTTAGDYTNHTTFVSYPSSTSNFGNGMQYTYQARDTTTRKLYIKVRSKSQGVSTGGGSLIIDNGTPINIPATTTNTWTWVSVNAPALNTTSSHSIKIIPTNHNMEFSKIYISNVAP